MRSYIFADFSVATHIATILFPSFYFSFSTKIVYFEQYGSSRCSLGEEKSVEPNQKKYQNFEEIASRTSKMLGTAKLNEQQHYALTRQKHLVASENMNISVIFLAN